MVKTLRFRPAFTSAPSAIYAEGEIYLPWSEVQMLSSTRHGKASILPSTSQYCTFWYPSARRGRHLRPGHHHQQPELRTGAGRRPPVRLFAKQQWPRPGACPTYHVQAARTNWTGREDMEVARRQQEKAYLHMYCSLHPFGGVIHQSC
jgi:hypothetical protein